jgi:putative protease
MIRKPELLAPAGSFESLKAAVSAGADAVYLGGKLFSARAYATNFDEETLIKAIEYCHLYDVKIYLTINTLLKDHEMPLLYDYLVPLYKKGLDAVIVQDLGAIYYIRHYFPELPIHGSTQMHIQDVYGVEFLKDLGLERVVLSRELTLDEIKSIKQSSTMEIETFVHGALCYCYSGQCLMSSILGGRSGNRGRCAQPCRLPYTYQTDSKDHIGTAPYLLSPKDINTLEILPQLIQSGIDSFKIEGRMKRPEYVAGVTSIYRKYIDEYVAYGKLSETTLEKDIIVLQDLFNRGGFSKGYYLGKNNEEMIVTEKPNHWGRAIGKAVQVKKRELYIELSEDVNKGDLLEIGKETSKDNYTVKEDQKKGSLMTLILRSHQKVQVPETVYRVKNADLLEGLNKEYIEQDKKLYIQGYFILRKNQPLQGTLTYKEHSVTMDGPMVEVAQKQPISKNKIEEQLRKTGQTLFEFDALHIEVDEDIFIPVSSLNQIRRNLIELLENTLVQSKYRAEPILQQLDPIQRIPQVGKKIHASFDSLEKAYIGVEIDEIDRIYVAYSPKEEKALMNFIDLCKTKGKKVYLMMPPIFREAWIQEFHNMLNRIKNTSLEGFVVRTYAQFEFLKDSGKELLLDYNNYVFNSFAVRQWQSLNQYGYTLSPELHYKEMNHLPLEQFDLWAYGYLPLMVSDQCVEKTAQGCKRSKGTTQLVDRYNKGFPVIRNCDYCYTTIYNSSPTSLFDQLKTIETMGIKNIRLHFTFEKEDEVDHIIKEFIKVFLYKEEGHLYFEDFNRGHFLRGVE